MSEQERIILQYLDNSYTGARMLDDISAMTRIARAIVAFEADPTEDILAADFNDYTERLWKEAYERGKRDAQPRKGKWINHRNDEGHNIADCDQCGEAMQWFDDDIKPNYCPNCGARMEESE